MWEIGIKGRINVGLVLIRVRSVLGIAYIRADLVKKLLFGEISGNSGEGVLCPVGSDLIIATLLSNQEGSW